MGLGLRPSRGEMLVLPESTLEDLIWRLIGTGGGLSRALFTDTLCRWGAASAVSSGGTGSPDTLSDSRPDSAPLDDLNRGDAEAEAEADRGGLEEATERDGPPERRLVVAIAALASSSGGCSSCPLA